MSEAKATIPGKRRRQSVVLLAVAFALFQLVAFAHDAEHLAGDNPQHCAACMTLDLGAATPAALPVAARLDLRGERSAHFDAALHSLVAAGSALARAPPRS